MKILRYILLALVGLALTPFCISATMAVYHTIQAISQEPDAVPVSALAFAIGFILWVVLYFITPRPIRTYVLAHELTHALWAYLTGGSVSQMKLSKEGGSVAVSGNNIIVTLAPYFFPLYTVLVILLYAVTMVFFDVSRYEMFWLAAVGLTWSFHVTFTISTLMQHQKDISIYGPILSYTVIYLLNILEIGLWIVAVSSPTIELFVGILKQDSGFVVSLIEKYALFWQ